MKEQMLNEWCDRLIEVHSNKDNIIDKLRVDGAKQIKTMIKTKGWEKLKEYINENKDKMLASNMVGPHALGVFYLDVKSKMWSIERKCQ